MASSIWEFFGYRAEDKSSVARNAAKKTICPILGGKCEKRFNDGIISGVCTIKPITTSPVICCPIRLYAEDYKILHAVSLKAFGEGLNLLPGRDAALHAKTTGSSCVAVFGKRWGGELRLPQRDIVKCCG
jgi:hypothetical protein